MTFSLFIVQLQHAHELRFMAVGGFCLGILIVVFGLHARRKQASVANGNSSAAPSLPQRRASESSAQMHEVIRLSSSTAPTRSSEMTQQEKIAAALTRAGVSLSDPWKQTSAVALESPDEAESESPTPSAVTVSPASHKANVLLGCGIIMSMASLCLLVIAR